MEATEDEHPGPDATSSLTTEGDFKQFVEPHWSALAKFARHVAPFGSWEDVLQEAMTTAWRKRHQYDSAKGTARNWLLAIVADKAAKNRRRKFLDQQPLTDTESTVSYHTEHNRRIDLEHAVATLSPRQRQAVVLFYFVDLSQTDVAHVMRCSVDTVKATLAQAKQQLARTLGKDYHYV